MATVIDNIRNVPVNADLAAYRAADDHLEKLSFLETVGQKISDFFKSFSAAGKFELATRNALVAVQINKLASEAMDGAINSKALSSTQVHAFNASNVRTLDALVNQVKSAPLQQERKTAILTHLDGLRTSFENEGNPAQAMKHASSLRALENVLFGLHNNLRTADYGTALTTSVRSNFMSGNTPNTLYASCGAAMSKHGLLTLPLNTSIHKGGAATTNRNIQNAEENLANKRSGGATAFSAESMETLQTRFAQTVLQETFPDSFDAAGPMLAHIINPDMLPNVITHDLLGAQTEHLDDVRITMEPANVRVTAQQETFPQDVRIQGSVRFRSMDTEGADFLSEIRFDVTINVDALKKLPEELKHHGTGTAQDGKQSYMPIVSVSRADIHHT